MCFFLLYLFFFMNSRVCLPTGDGAESRRRGIWQVAKTTSGARDKDFLFQPHQPNWVYARTEARLQTNRPICLPVILTSPSFFLHNIFFFRLRWRAHLWFHNNNLFRLLPTLGNSWNISHRKEDDERWAQSWERNRTFFINYEYWICN